MKKRVCCAAGILLAMVLWTLFLFHDQNTKEFPQTLHVAVIACKIRNGAGIEYDLVGWLSEDDEVIALDLVEDAEGGTWYKIDKRSLPDNLNISADECYIRSDLLMINE